MPLEVRRQLRQMACAAEAGFNVSLDLINSILSLRAMKEVMFNVRADGKSGRMVTRYARRLRRALTESGEIDLTTFPYARVYQQLLREQKATP